MAEKPEELVTSEEKIAKAKELYGRGCRNYYVKSYAEATEDLSQACTYYSEVYGPSHDELGEVYLLYGKALIAVGQEENKLIDVPEGDESEEGAEGQAEGEGEGDDDDDEEEEGSTENGDDKKEEEEISKDEEESKDSAEASETTENGTEEKKEQNGHSTEIDDQPGPSGLNGKSADDENEEEDDGNLQVAWEVLEIAADIFEKQGEKAESNLLEAYSELAGISVENGNFDLAIKDYGRAMQIFTKMAEPNKRIGAEMYYKLGLCQVMIKLYDESVKSFQKAHDFLNDVLEKEQMKEEKCEETIKDLEELKQEILNKILEVGDVKAEEMEQVKKELSKFFNHQPESASSDGAGTSSSSSAMKSPEAEKPKPTDISHLIKRKKPDTATSSSEVESSPAKKVALDNSK